MVKNLTSSSVQLSLFPCQGTGVNDAHNGSTSTAKLSTYMTSREALWRLLATYPADMPVQQAVLLARVDFTKARKEVTL